MAHQSIPVTDENLQPHFGAHCGNIFFSQCISAFDGNSSSYPVRRLIREGTHLVEIILLLIAQLVGSCATIKGSSSPQREFSFKVAK